MRKIGPYEPCPCGSGLKYKFCCYLRFKCDTDSDNIDVKPSGSSVFKYYAEQAEAFKKIASDNARGLMLMTEAKHEFAIKHFRRAYEKAPNLPTGGNNLAACYFYCGQHEKALEIQKKTNERSDTPNPFGHANMAIFHRYRNEVEKGSAALDTAITLDMPSVDALIRVFQALALYRRHSDIWELFYRFEEAQDSAVNFYGGCAAANLGNLDRAKALLGRVRGGDRVGLARLYLQWLRTGREPSTVSCDWYYLSYGEMAGIVDIAILDEDEAIGSLLTVNYYETLLNNLSESNIVEQVINMLRVNRHPQAIELLERLAFGTFGSDQLRVSAFMALNMRSDVSEDMVKNRKVFLKGEWSKIQGSYIKMNDSITYGEDLSDELQELYDQTVLNTNGKHTDWKKNELQFRKILEQAPGYFPARFNLAATLVNQRVFDEALEILEDLVVSHPEYLIARAALLEIYLHHGHNDKAMELVKATKQPEATHPNMMVAWMLALATFYRKREEYDEMLDAFRLAYKINPNHPKCRFFIGVCRAFGLGYKGEFDDEFDNDYEEW